MFQSLFKLVARKISLKLGIGFGVVAISGFVATCCALTTAVSVGSKLHHLSGPVWDSAHSAMQSQISMQSQIIAANQLLSDRSTAKIEQRIRAFDAAAERELAKVVQARFHDANLLHEISQLHQSYQRSQTRLLSLNSKCDERKNNFRQLADAMNRFSHRIKEIGDGMLEDLALEPELALSWNTGIEKRWQGADGAMESRIGYLNQIRATQLIVDSLEPDIQRKQLIAADAMQDQATELMVNSGRYELPVGAVEDSPATQTQPILTEYMELTHRFRNARDLYIETHLALNDAVLQFSTDAKQLLARVQSLSVLAEAIVDDYSAKAKEDIAASLRWVVVVGILGLLVGITSSVVCTRTLTHGVQEMSHRLQAMAVGKGELRTRLPEDRQDELGDAARAFNAFADQLFNLVQEIGTTAIEISGTACDLAVASEQVTSGAATTTSQSTTVAAASEQMSGSIRSVSHSADSIAENMRAIVSKLSDMGSTIRRIVNDSENSAETVANARRIVGDSSQSVSELDNSAADIARILEVIQEIAAQTNLLALNATIEAARAGDAGKGFSVVAAEVKTLAQQTALASDEIRSKVQSIQTTTKSAIGSIEQIRLVVDNVSGIVESISSAIQEQSSSTDAIRHFVSETSQTVEIAANAARETSTVSAEITRSVMQVNRIAHDTATGAEQYRHVGERLTRLSANLKTLVSQFND
ncbi:methyl-accepting chemotaxis protein [Aureliella helgolandensis]|uniref:Methyl-accepting chemotaxis protein YoaH n=1 Tax=Aureliella helgolandensis TaxID=2527968 RepID=A0A518G6Q1_9BACT|nr:methyl-accepting chemotaxis protein [Aureliella helgolandensis]QDV24259.1 Putative methyl-accepting chemotaxis protein YoaH [Aureliella helgolandensis]